MKQIPFYRPTISKKDLISVLEYLIDEDTSMGKTTENFEKEMGKALSLNDQVILCNSGASALFLIFQHIGIQKNDEIIMSPLCEPWVAEVINFFSALPIWIDISVETLQMNPEQIIQRINSNTRAIILNHHFGYPFFMNSTKNSPLFFLKNYPQIKVIEDVTSGLFTRYHDQCLGSIGDYGFTCLESRRIITTGKGGAAFSRHRKEANEIKQLRSYREKKETKDKDLLFPKRLDLCLSDMQAALGISELSLVDKMIARCEQIKQFYQNSLAKTRHSFISVKQETLSNHNVFPVILHGTVSSAQKIFTKEKIEIKDIVQGTCYERLPYLKELKNLHQLKHKVIQIPIYPTLKKEEIEKIAQLLGSIP